MTSNPNGAAAYTFIITLVVIIIMYIYIYTCYYRYHIQKPDYKYRPTPGFLTLLQMSVLFRARATQHFVIHGTAQGCGGCYRSGSGTCVSTSTIWSLGFPLFGDHRLGEKPPKSNSIFLELLPRITYTWHIDKWLLALSQMECLSNW